jgi:hypothetical protein
MRTVKESIMGKELNPASPPQDSAIENIQKIYDEGADKIKIRYADDEETQMMILEAHEKERLDKVTAEKKRAKRAERKAERSADPVMIKNDEDKDCLRMWNLQMLSQALKGN